MKYTGYEEFEGGDKVRVLTNFYEKWGIKQGDILIVDYMNDSENVKTNKGWIDADVLEFIEN